MEAGQIRVVSSLGLNRILASRLWLAGQTKAIAAIKMGISMHVTRSNFKPFQHLSRHIFLALCTGDFSKSVPRILHSFCAIFQMLRKRILFIKINSYQKCVKNSSLGQFQTHPRALEKIMNEKLTSSGKLGKLPFLKSNWKNLRLLEANGVNGKYMIKPTVTRIRNTQQFLEM